jgi:ADP-ribose pyrophosphatase YjhB (NUDIX family)
MSCDILFKTDTHMFSYRVAGLLVRNGKILLQRDKWGDHAVPGGHVNFMETTEETLKREFLEEIQAKIGVDRLLAVQENFFMWGSKPCHQIHFYYQIHLEEENIPLEGEFPVCDQLGDLRVDLDFVWVPLENLKSISVYPREIETLLEKRNGVMHFVSSELKPQETCGR